MPYREAEIPEPAARISAAFAESIGAACFGLWYPPNARFEWSGESLHLVCRNNQFRDWSRDQFGEVLQSVANRLMGHEVVIHYQIESAKFDDAPPRTEPKPPVNLLGEREAVKAKPVRTRRWKGFGEFVIGAENRVAAAAAQAILDDDGMGPNPLVIHGPTGTGKTHLLEAVVSGLAAWKKQPLYLPAEEFTHRFVQASRKGRTAAFRKLTRAADALLIDDLQFLAGKKATQEEFTHLLDAFAAQGKPVVIAMDTHPRLADELPAEITDRLLGGVSWGLLPPEAETRLAILQSKAVPPLPADVLAYAAKKLTGNVRELEGALHTLRHYAKVSGEPITLAVAEDLLSNLVRRTVRVTGLEDVDKATCEALKLAGGSLQSRSRAAVIAHSRMLAVYLARKLTNATFGEIAKHFGLKQHSTAIAAEKKVRGWLKDRTSLFDDSAADLLAKIERILNR